MKTKTPNLGAPDERINLALTIAKDPGNEIIKDEYQRLVIADAETAIKAIPRAQILPSHERAIATAISRVAEIADSSVRQKAIQRLIKTGVKTAPRRVALARQFIISKPTIPAAPFLSLGYAEGIYYYLPHGTNQVVALTAANHSKLHLLGLAPLLYWTKAYGGEAGNVAWTCAASETMATCVARGIFNPLRIRGRGAWHDAGRSVVHVGDSVLVDGEKRGVGQFETNGYIYPAAIPLSLELATPLGNAEAQKLVKLVELLPWERPINAQLFAGWLAVAPVCGALAWRPHIWITGSAGTGKSWIMDNIMRPALGRFALFVQSDTTEAGIRQALGYDARPVLFDEAEGESERAQARMQNVLGLVRQSSSENGSIIVKGSAAGNVKTYCIRSCFAFSSIGVGLKQHADLTRINVLGLKKIKPPEGDSAFFSLRKLVEELLTPNFVARLHARLIALIPKILANAETFSISVSKKIDSKRVGDQVGTLLAGLHSLFSDQIITQANADDWVNKQDWSEEKETQNESDEALCFQRLLQHVIRLQDCLRPRDLSVAELIESASENLNPEKDACKQALLRFGIKLENHSIIVANQHAGIQAVMNNTPWGNWRRILKRLPGATSTPAPVRFAGLLARGVSIPREGEWR